MVTAVGQDDFKVNHFIATQDAGGSRFADAVINGGNELPGNHTADNLVFKAIANTRCCRFDGNDTVTVLTVTAGLAHIAAFSGCGLGNGLFVGDLRLADSGLYLKLTQHTVNNDFKVQFAHAGDDGLPCFLVGVSFEGGIFLSKALKSKAHFFLSCLGFGFDGHVDNGVREIHLFKDNRVFLITQGITGCGELQADRSGNVAGGYARKIFTVVSMHLKHTA